MAETFVLSDGPLEKLLGWEGGEGWAGQVQKNIRSRGKLNEKKFMYAN